MKTPRPTALLPRRGFQWDLARQVERLDVLLRLLPKYADWGYQELYLHLEDSIEYPSLPGVARGDAYRYREMERLVKAASRVGIGVVPIVNLLGHTQYLLKVPEWRDLNELRDEHDHPLLSGQICPLHPRMPEVAEKLIRDTAPFCTTGKIHVGLDESFHLGKCPRCRAEVEQVGLAGHFARHVHRLHSLVASRSLRLGLWADMLNFVPEAIPQLPTDIVAYDWYYYPFRRHPRVELFGFAESDLATPLQARGIEYWGCAMNGAFRYEPLPVFADRLDNLRSWWRRCQRVQAAGMLVCSWEAYRLAFELPAVVDAAAASLWKGEDSSTDEPWLRRGFARLYGPRVGTRAARLALASDRYPFAGYAKWDVNDGWTHRAGMSPPQAEARWTRRLAKASRALPAALHHSLALRAYFADRDFFLTSAAESVFAARRARARGRPAEAARLLARLARETQRFRRRLDEADRAERGMWLASRRATWRSQNRGLLQKDRERLQTWERWLESARSEPSLVEGDTPVCGAWQLIFTVVNFAPALQRVSVEEQQDDGTWRERRARHTIEFQAIAARPRSAVRRLFSTPLQSTDRALRLVLRGVGPVKITRVRLTNGVEVRRARLPNGAMVLGRAAPRSGLPDLTTLQAIHPLSWAESPA